MRGPERDDAVAVFGGGLQGAWGEAGEETVEEGSGQRTDIPSHDAAMVLSELKHVNHCLWDDQLVRYFLLCDDAHTVFPTNADTGDGTIIDCLEGILCKRKWQKTDDVETRGTKKW
jgi:hypothetical protein